jgi:PAS domain S-box-containing protein
LEKEDLGQKAGEDRTGSPNGFLNLVLESLPHPFYVIDVSNYRITVANSAAQFGPLSEDSTCYSLTHKRDEPCGSAAHPCPVEEIKKTKKPLTLEHVHFDRDGNPRDVQIYAYPILDTAGNVSQIIEYSLDITERKQMQKALWNSLEQYRQVLETMNEGFSMVDANQNRIYANKRLCEMLGYEMDEIVDTPATKILDDTNAKLFAEQFDKRQKGDAKPYEITLTGKDGRKVPTIVSPKPVFDENGNFTGSFSVITDITELKRTEQALKEREEELEIKAKNLEEANVALKILLQRIEEDKIALEENVLSNTKELIAPYLTKLMNSKLDETQKGYANILETNLNNITSSFAHAISSKYLNLTPTELRVANLVREGKTTKEIADLLNLSSRTVETHRKNIRKKLGLTDKKANLRSKLLSLQ